MELRVSWSKKNNYINKTNEIERTNIIDNNNIDNIFNTFTLRSESLKHLNDDMMKDLIDKVWSLTVLNISMPKWC